MCPKELHDKLEQEAKKKGLTGKAKDRYVYGTLHRVEKAQQNKHDPKGKKK